LHLSATVCASVYATWTPEFTIFFPKFVAFTEEDFGGTYVEY